jgi:hypothetical protein
VRERRVEVCPTIDERRRDRLEALHDRRGELRFRPEAVEQQLEDPIEGELPVDRRIALPVLPVREDRAAAHGRDDEIAVDPLVERQAVVGYGTEAVVPVRGGVVPGLPGGGRKVVEATVVLLQAEAARPRGVVLELGVEELGREVCKGRFHGHG